MKFLTAINDNLFKDWEIDGNSEGNLSILIEFADADLETLKTNSQEHEIERSFKTCE